MFEDPNTGEFKKSDEEDDSETWSYSPPSYTRFTFTGKAKSRLGRHRNKPVQKTSGTDEVQTKEDKMLSVFGGNDRIRSNSHVPKTPSMSWLRGDTFPPTNPFTPGTHLSQHTRDTETSVNDSGIEVSSSRSNFLFNLKNDPVQSFNCKRNLAFSTTPFKSKKEESRETTLKDLNQFVPKSSYPAFNLCLKKEENKENAAEQNVDQLDNKEANFIAPSWAKLKEICDTAIPATTKTTETVAKNTLNRAADEPQKPNIFAPFSFYNRTNEQKKADDDLSNTPLDLSSGENLGNRNIFSRSITGGSDHSSSDYLMSSAKTAADHTAKTLDDTKESIVKDEDTNQKNTSDAFSGFLPKFLVPTNKAKFKEPHSQDISNGGASVIPVTKSPPLNLNDQPPEMSNAQQKPLTQQPLKNGFHAPFSFQKTQDCSTNLYEGGLKIHTPSDNISHRSETLPNFPSSFKKNFSSSLPSPDSESTPQTCIPRYSSHLEQRNRTDSKPTPENAGSVITTPVELVPTTIQVPSIGSSFGVQSKESFVPLATNEALGSKYCSGNNQFMNTVVNDKNKTANHRNLENPSVSSVNDNCVPKNQPDLKQAEHNLYNHNRNQFLQGIHRQVSQEKNTGLPEGSFKQIPINQRSTPQLQVQQGLHQFQVPLEKNIPLPQTSFKQNPVLGQSTSLTHPQQGIQQMQVFSEKNVALQQTSLKQHPVYQQFTTPFQPQQEIQQGIQQIQVSSEKNYVLQPTGLKEHPVHQQFISPLQPQQEIQQGIQQQIQVSSEKNNALACSNLIPTSVPKQPSPPQKQDQLDSREPVASNAASSFQQTPQFANQKTYLAPQHPSESGISNNNANDFPCAKPEIPQQIGNRANLPVMKKPQNNFKMAAPRGLPSRANTELYVNGKAYTILSMLGRGGSSEVYQVLDPRSSKLMAVKCVDLSMVDRTIADGYLNEIDLLSKLQGCASVIRMFDHEYVQELKMLYVVMEKGDTDLSQLIRDISKTKKISMSMIIYYWTEILTAVRDIHEQGIIHSDLKPANFLLVSGRLKLIDFGIASSQGDMTSVVKEVTTGTWNYMSPEALRNTNGSGKGFKITYKSDVWSLGCILYNLVYGKTPFSHITNTWGKLQAIADPNHQVEFPDVGAPAVLTEALRSCFHRDPKQRPTVVELLRLPYHDTGEIGRQIMAILPHEYWLKVSHLFPGIKTNQT